MDQGILLSDVAPSFYRVVPPRKLIFVFKRQEWTTPQGIISENHREQPSIPSLVCKNDRARGQQILTWRTTVVKVAPNGRTCRHSTCSIFFCVMVLKAFISRMVGKGCLFTQIKKIAYTELNTEIWTKIFNTRHASNILIFLSFQLSLHSS